MDPRAHRLRVCREAWPGIVYGLTVGGWGALSDDISGRQVREDD